MIRFHQKEVLSDVSSFKVSDNQLAYCFQDKIYLDKVKIVEGTSSYFFYQNKLYFHQNSNTFLLNEYNSIIKIADFSFTFETLFEGTIIIGRDIKVEDFLTFEISTTYEIVNILNYEVEKKLPHRYSNYLALRFKNKYFGSDIKKTTLKSLSLITGEYEWEVSIKAEDNIVSILGVEKEVLVVCVQHPDLSFGLLGIDVQTGAIRWQKDDWKWLKGYHTVLHNGKILSLKGDFAGNTHFIEAEASTATILRSGELPALKQAGISIFNYTLQDNYIYFTAHPIGKSEANTIGVLDYNSLKLLWWQEVALENDAFFGASNKPEVAANKLYILDTGGTLHIFERETI